MLLVRVLAIKLCALGVLMTGLQSQAAAPGQPFASYWHPTELLTWDPVTDPDAAFNRANTPLATQFLNPAFNRNPHARVNEARVASLVAFGPTSDNPSQGSLTMSYYAPNYWQYMDVLVFWGGSAGEGLILAPNATVIDAAHRNGVAVLGNVFFPPTAYGGQIQWVRDFVQKSGTRFPVADKLIQVAQHYGFDGWFINQETAGGDTALANDMRAMMRYLQTNSTLRIMWYDAMTESGSVSWQNALTSANDGFFQDGTRIAHDMFLNFWWGSSGLTSSRNLAQSLGRSPYDLYTGIDVEGSGYSASVNWTALFPEGSAHKTSLGLYRPEWTRNSSSSVADFYVRDNRFWAGWNRDPSNTSTANAWKGIAHYVPAKSPINRMPFVTGFNTGHGNRYAVNGQVVRTGEWNNLSVQDVLPTWRWIMRSPGVKLVPDLDWADAYYGGTSLKISGTLSATNDLDLFHTSLPVAEDTSLRLVFKTGVAGAASRMKVSLAFEDSPSTYEYLDVGTAATSGWNTKTFSLSAYAGRKIALIGLRFESPTAVGGYSMRVGQLAVMNGAVSAPAPATALTVDRVWSVDANTATARLKWDHSPSPVYCYNVYRRNPDNSRTWLGATPNNAYFVAELRRVGAEAFAPIEVETVGLDFGHSSPAKASVYWPFPGVQAYYKFENNALDSGGYGNHGTVAGAPSYAAGRIESAAMTFNGVNQHVEIPNTAANDFSISFWVKTTATGGTGQWWAGQGLVDGEVSGVAADFGTSLLGNKAAFGVGNTDLTISSITAINDGQWHHVLAARTGSSGLMRLYVDGTLQGSAMGPAGARTAPGKLRLGGILSGGGFFNGSLDDVRIYNYALSFPEVTRLAKGGATLVAHYKLEGSAADTSGFGNTGTANALTYGPGKVDNFGASFNGINSYLQIPGAVAHSFSVAFWVRTTTTGGTGQWENGKGLMDGAVPGSTNDFGVALVGDKAAFGLGNPDVTISSTTPINDGEWHHVAATRSGINGVMRLYVDGVNQAGRVGPMGPRFSPA
ncbi:MAG TPA: LamG-like jellyroll fold domain-containing protein, partial [Clostridia bacterium]|nr:LamG-like jellyroll fold domain-containing protein [Clostridia bacterium]